MIIKQTYIFIVSIFLCSIFFIPSCQIKNDNKKETLIKVLKETKEQVKLSHENHKLEHMKRYKNLCLDFSKSYPDDSLAPHYIFEAASVCISSKEYDSAVTILKKIDKYYKDFLKRPETIYTLGIINGYYLGKKGLEKEYYEKLIKLYPAHILSKNATNALRLLHLTDKEIIEKFAKENKK